MKPIKAFCFGVSLLLCGTVFVAPSVAANAQNDEIILSGDDYLDYWLHADTALITTTSGEKGLSSTTGKFNWQTETFDSISDFTLISKQNLQNNTSTFVIGEDDWKYEYLTISTSALYGFDDSTKKPTGENSVSISWGGLEGFRVFERNSLGIITFEDKVGSTALTPTGELTVEQDLIDASNESHARITQISVSVNPKADGCDFNFKLITAVMINQEYAYKYCDFSYSSTSTSFANPKFVSFGRTQNKEQIQLNNRYVNFFSANGQLSKKDISINSSKWYSLSNIEIDNAMHGNNYPAFGITSPFGGNSISEITIDLSGLGGLKAGIVYMLKGYPEEMAETIWSFNESDSTISASNTVGSWMALVITDNLFELWKCIDGVCAPANITFNNLAPASYVHLGSQINRIKVQTTDLDSGTSFNIKYTSTYLDTVSQTASAEFTSSDCFPRVASLGYCIVGSDAKLTTENNKVVTVINSINSSYTTDPYLANMFHNYVDAISYTSIDKTNYVTVEKAMLKANYLYNNFSQEQKNILDPNRVDKLDQTKQDLAAIDKVNIFTSLVNDLVIPQTVDRTDYPKFKAKFEDCRFVYNELNDTQKATIEETVKDKYDSAAQCVLYFDDSITHADQVIAAISKITLPIVQYAQSRTLINDANTLYNDLYDDEKPLVTNYSHLKDAITALAQYEEDHKITGFNFATNVNNFVNIEAYEGFTSSADGLRVDYDSKSACIYTSKQVGDAHTVTYTIDSQLSKCSWGDFFFIFKSDTCEKHHSNGAWLQKGNYGVLVIGSDGFKVTECINGKLKQKTDAYGNPIADYLVDFGIPTVSSGSMIDDISKIYTSYTTLSIKVTDKYNTENEYIGYEAEFTLTGGYTGETVTKTYTSTNALAKDGNFTGLELYLSHPIRNSNGGGFLLKGYQEEDVTNYDGSSEIKEIEDTNAATNCDNLLKKVITEKVDASNYSRVTEAYKNANNAYVALNSNARSKLTVSADCLAVAASNLSSYELVSTVDKNLLTIKNTSVNANNALETSELIESTREMAKSLSEDQKAMLTNDLKILDDVQTEVNAVLHPVYKDANNQDITLAIVLPCVFAGVIVLVGLGVFLYFRFSNKHRKRR